MLFTDLTEKALYPFSFGGKIMAQLSRTTPRNQGQQQRSSLAFIYAGLVFGILFCLAVISGVYFTLEAAFGSPWTPPIAHAAQLERHVQANLSIVINQPGYQKDWPAYAPNTLVVPANSLVTITLRDNDMGDTPLPKGSPFTTIQGVVGGVAYADGHAYTALAPDKIAHTFTIPQLHINVPLPGDTTTGKSYDVVTFTFRTGATGSYFFQCFDPCGTGSNGWEGPMVTKGYMHGTLTVQG
jgi:heme/copper-type cytochrome/quinol oxidase subunit 2